MLEGRRARAPHSLGSFFQKGYSWGRSHCGLIPLKGATC
jgi:hypothetical protein